MYTHMYSGAATAQQGTSTGVHGWWQCYGGTVLESDISGLGRHPAHKLRQSRAVKWFQHCGDGLT